MKCPCHSGKEYTNCCAPYHDGASPPTPTALMRSRYSAYALGKAPYIMETTHSSHPDKKRPPAEWKEQILAFSNGVQFTGLDILEAQGNFVTFRAYLGSAGSFTEKSEFEKEEGRWRYKRALSIT
ncbi:MAG: SEC-C domain-containing protein [Chlamydiales bacterium]|nr:SEC-C domain-containing protein [Chlamydiales bacterium]